MCTVAERESLSIVKSMAISVSTNSYWPTHLLGLHFDYPVLHPSETWSKEAVKEYNDFVSNLSHICKHICVVDDEATQRAYVNDIVGGLVYNLKTFGCRTTNVSLTVVLLSLHEVLFGLYYLFSPEQIAFLWLKLAEISTKPCRTALLSQKMLQKLMESTHVDLRSHALDIDVDLEMCFKELSVEDFA